MAIPRKDALKRLQSLTVQVELHLDKIARNPGDRSVPHYQGEVRNWLRDMRAVLRHLGRRTAAQWQARIDAYRAALGD